MFKKPINVTSESCYLSQCVPEVVVLVMPNFAFMAGSQFNTMLTQIIDLKSLLHFYCSFIIVPSLQTALDLLTLADRYGFLSLHYSIGKSICKSGVIKISNILQTLFYADSCNAEMLHRHCVQYLNAEAEAIIESQSMMDLPKENLKWLLSRDFFIANELKIFEAVKKWKECNGFEVDEIADLLKCVRLSEISPNEIISTVCPSGLYPEAVTEEALRQKLSFQNKSKSRGKKGIDNYV